MPRARTPAANARGGTTRPNFGSSLLVPVFLVTVSCSAPISLSPEAEIGAAGTVESDRRAPIPQLEKEVEIGAYEAKPVRQIFTELAFALFGGRLEVIGQGDPQYLGEVALGPLHEALDRVCEASQCAWDVRGTPPTLVLYTEGFER